MRAMFGLVLLIGMALAGFAVYMAQGYINQTESALTAERSFREKLGEVVPVYVVTEQLGFGDPITKDNVQQIYWQKSALPEGTFSEEDALFPPETDKPRYALRPMEINEPVLAIKVTKPGEPAGLGSALQRGMRAFAVRVDVSSGVSGFVYPGNSVDIYWTGTTEKGDVTRMIENNVAVIAVDQSASGDATGGAIVAQTVTVAATPEQVARLAQAQATGRLALSLVGSDDDSVSGAVEADATSLLGPAEPEKVVTAAPVAQVCTIKTRKGAEVLEIPIPCTN
ncbi:Flp pilus assembly protein CpaB [Paragemmobacter straminiformis]|uniref:Flp pilus assembly protein CpaB n=1 Tax=Paragemmobacter straminiformis TaxID=2045119 RepID=A0A842I5Z0_9RHOB|nr:Flp pilus assembly protein CpaB [Gemmobacter straminiformis]MBC2834368.1 Flp pilus assembly protein CpaB [Gemmobacter straminiformis]